MARIHRRILATLVGLVTLFAVTTSGCVCMVVVPVRPFQEVQPLPKEDPPEPPKPPEPPRTEACLQVLTTIAQFGPTQIRCETPKVKEIVLRHNGHGHCPKAIQITGLKIQQEQQTGFRIERGPTLPFTLQADNNLTFQVSYRAKVLITEQAKLVVSTDHPEQQTLQATLEAQGVEVLEKRDLHQQRITKTDILFVVDASRSMRQEQANLVKNFSSFIQWATRLHSDFQVGVLPIRVSQLSSACLVGTPRILTSQTKDLQSAFAANLGKLGTHSGREQGLESAFQALRSPAIDDPSCNKGFMRKDAVLSIVFISDEPDQSAEFYEYYRDFFAKLKGPEGKSRVRISAVVGPEPRGCTSSFGRASPGPRYLKLAKEFQGISASICEENWAKSLERIGLRSIVQQLKFKLQSPPEISSIVVKVNDKIVPKSNDNGWEYLPKTNEILFRGSYIPIPGSKIELRYLVTCD